MTTGGTSELENALDAYNRAFPPGSLSCHASIALALNVTLNALNSLPDEVRADALAWVSSTLASECGPLSMRSVAGMLPQTH